VFTGNNNQGSRGKELEKTDVPNTAKTDKWDKLTQLNYSITKSY
jgi:hypothetical protein